MYASTPGEMNIISFWLATLCDFSNIEKISLVQNVVIQFQLKKWAILLEYSKKDWFCGAIWFFLCY